jgi:hypothetical protein
VKAGSVEWWFTHDVPTAVPLGEGEPEARQRDREFRVVRPGMRYIPDESAAETYIEEEERAWQVDDFDPADLEFEPHYFTGSERSDAPANWELQLDALTCVRDGCDRPKAPNRRQCWACIKRQQRHNDLYLNGENHCNA